MVNHQTLNCSSRLLVTISLVLASCGCRQDQPASSDKPPSTGPSGAPASQPVYLHAPPGADKDDDPAHPRALARTGDVPGWVKTRAVRMATSDNLSQMVTDSRLLAAVKAARIESVASCRYNNLTTSAEVLFIRGFTSADAYGLLSILTPQPGQLNPSDRSIRASDSDGASLRLIAQQGPACIWMEVAGRIEFETVQRSARRLLDFIVFNLPADDPPLLMQLLPTADRIWFCREMGFLAKVEHPLVRQLRPAAVNQTLGLGNETGLWIAAMPPSNELPGHLIWMAEYQNPADATAAHTRCRDAGQEGATPMGLRLTALEPKDARLLGVWSEQALDPPASLETLREALPR